MTDQRLSSFLRAIALIGVVACLAGVALAGATAAVDVEAGPLVAVMATLPFGLVVWFVAPQQPRSPLTWVLASFVLLVGMYPMGETLVALNWPGLELPGWEDPVPPNLPLAYIVTYGVVQSVSSVGILGLLTFGLLLFPDGRLPSRRWRWLGYFCGAGLAYWLVAQVPLALMRASDVQSSLFDLMSLVWFIPLLGAPICLASLVARFRRADPITRSQIKWIMWGAAIFVPAGVISVSGSGPEPLAAVGLVTLATSYGIAISKYRLFDIDVVISRTLVYGALAIFIGVVYVGLVVGIGYLIGAGDDPDPGLGIMATVIIAIAFQPLRRQLQRLANRVVYGRRATPYEVLSTFSQGVSAVDPDVLADVARSLAEGTTAEAASIWIDRGDDLQCIAAWPDAPAVEDIAGFVALPVVHDGHELGRVVVDVPPGQPFPVTDRQLLDQVVAGLGLALRNLQLTEDLRDRVDQLAASRRRIVAVQDETRRRLERDLHDGAQQRLVSLKIKLGVGTAMAERVGLDDVRSLLESLKQDADQTIDSIRDFARGIYPPLLEAEGLGDALSAHTRKMPIPVTVRTRGVGRYSKEHEATVYFCVLEALQNAMKHSGASSVQVLLEEQGGSLSFEVRDDGGGFDATRVSANGLVNMRDRVETAGGVFEVDTWPGSGTRVFGSVPVKRLVAT